MGRSAESPPPTIPSAKSAFSHSHETLCIVLYAPHHTRRAAGRLSLLPEFPSVAEERPLIEQIMTLDFSEVRMHGVAAKQRVPHFGWIYGYESWRLSLQERAAHLLDREPKELSEVLVTEYPPHAGIGWHRDAPMFGSAVVGISVTSACRFRFRRDHAGRSESMTLTLEPRSLYILRGAGTSPMATSIPPTKRCAIP